ncbi:MAG: RlmE family RNA methyltransferase [Alphaproteobacteria bacterium]|jgi:23S rRNA (uridine2552-2'-O)-methyltransferase|nr:RlmE family RNA methyltransferase [Alphaproteobacteria bacterium]
MKKPVKKGAWIGKKNVSVSSRRYLDRQESDHYVTAARKLGYRSRAVFKLLEADEKYGLLKPGQMIIDLGAAPGSWSQAAAQRVSPGGQIFSLDKIPVDRVEGMTFLQGDFTKDEVYEEFLEMCPKGVDGVLSDIAPETSGHGGQDHLKIMMLAEMALDFALKTMRPGAWFYCKLFQGGEEAAFRDSLREHFQTVRFFKPEASRKDSKEIFIFAQNFQPK